jgi:hypothetical protein
MEFDLPLELLFKAYVEPETDDTGKLNMHIVYRSVVHRDQMLQIGFAQGINMAHNRLQDIVSKLK